ncbi:M48 family metallopeptidase [Paraflavisolibacter sp. H34]|uniref:M48 family metallopeptidase n=1 Tax=Huijunlia imazamoxiresistens TaxID=3127457 RepID=UPI0030174F52
MSSYNATYYYNASESPARVSLQKQRLSIVINEGASEVYWYFDQVRKEPGSSMFYYPGYPLQSLTVLDRELAAAITEKVERSKQKVIGSKSVPFVKLLLGFLLFLLLSYFVLIPWLAAALVGSFPVKYEKDLGEGAYASMKGGFEVDGRKSAYINDFFRELHFPHQYNIRITVIKNEEPNAFALPGGRIVVHDKILEGIGSYEELAALLAHELIHVEHRHTLRSLFRKAGAHLLLVFLIGDVDAVSAILLGNADRLKNLSYSRSLEKEADEEGARLMTRHGIDCIGFVRLFRALQKETAGPKTAEWMSSHPDLDKRIRNIQASPDCKNSRPVRNETLQTLFQKLKE